MKSHTSLVAQQTRLSEWADMVRDCQNRPQGMKIDEWCQLHDITWIFLSQETQIPVTWKPVFRSGNHHWLAWLILIRNRTNVKPRAALRGINRLYICEISCILYNCQSVSLSPDCVDTETGIFNHKQQT